MDTIDFNSYRGRQMPRCHYENCDSADIVENESKLPGDGRRTVGIGDQRLDSECGMRVNNNNNVLPRGGRGYLESMATTPPSYEDAIEVTNQPDNNGSPERVVKIRKPESNPMYYCLPTLAMPMAIFCCVVNFVLPGIGTIVASFSVLTCCARHESLPARIGIFILNAVCGVLQLGLSPFLIGWVWSIVWGCAFIGMATEYVPPTSTLQEPVSHQVVPPPPSYNPQQNVPFYPQDPPPPYYGATHGLSLEVHSQDTESEEVLESSVPPVDMT